jgi:hypothetical protein
VIGNTNQGALAANSNYTIQFTGSSLSINPATPAVLKGKKLSAVGLTAKIEPVARGGDVPTGTVAFEF